MGLEQKKNFGSISFVNILFFLSAALMLLVSVTFTLYIERMEKNLLDSIQNHLVAAAQAASGFLSIEELDLFHSDDDMERPEWDSNRAKLQKFAMDYRVLYVYYWRYHGDGNIQYIIDNDDDPDYMVTPGMYYDIWSDDTTAEAVLEIVDGKVWASDLGIYTATWDGVISAVVPVFREDGSVYCAAGVDLSDEIVLTVRNSIRITRIVQIVCLIISILSGFSAFQQYRKKAILSEKANLSKSQFLSTMSHEMRTPLNAIIGMTAIAKKVTDAQEKDRALKNIEGASAHLLGLINDVLDMAKIEANKLELSFVAFEFKTMIQNTMAITSLRVEEKRQSLSVTVDDAIPQFVIGDNQRLAQVIANLMSNAVKFTPEGGSIHFEASMVDEVDSMCQLRISVSDSGVGISPEQQTRMFQPFEQAESGTSREYGGTGLGLAISKSIVELMGGSIQVESALGEGSTFIFTVKVKRSDNTTAAEGMGGAYSEVSASAFAGAYKGKYMLLVEDVEINCEIVKSLLEDTELVIDCAENGEVALDMLKAAPAKYDIVFMDVHMPKMDGLEATKCIREMEDARIAGLPIIAMTANVFMSDIKDCIEVGMDDHLGKPLDLDKVYEVLRKYLAASEISQ